LRNIVGDARSDRLAFFFKKKVRSLTARFTAHLQELGATDSTDLFELDNDDLVELGLKVFQRIYSSACGRDCVAANGIVVAILTLASSH
jgi:hypothetical protein